MFNSLNLDNSSRLAVAGTATSLSPVTCWRGRLASLLATGALSFQRKRESSIEHPSSVLSRPSSVPAPLHLSRELYKSNLFMQNKANFKNTQIYTIAYYIRGYVNLIAFLRRKNKAKQSQFKPNFRPKLGSFCYKIVTFANMPQSVKYVLTSVQFRASFALVTYNLVLLFSLCLCLPFVALICEEGLLKLAFSAEKAYFLQQAVFYDNKTYVARPSWPCDHWLKDRGMFYYEI
jgi:hypothetical protein